MAIPPKPSVFAGDHLALDFLNSRVGTNVESQDRLAGGASFLQWLLDVGAIDSTVFQSFLGASTSLEDAAEEARGLRLWLLGLFDEDTGIPSRQKFEASIGVLNQLLARDSTFHAVEVTGDPDGEKILKLHIERRWTDATSLLQPIAIAIGDLFCNASLHLIKQCNASDCVLYFYDRTKAHRRRWCNMATCGNRAKAAANRARKGQAAK